MGMNLGEQERRMPLWLCNNKDLPSGEILDPDDKHYMKRKADLADRLYRMYDKIEDVELMQRRQYNEIRNDLFFCFRIKD